MSDRWPAATVGDALDVLADVALWQLAPDRWERTAAVLARMAWALAASDADAAADTVADLMELSPSRIVPIGSRTAAGIPDQILDLRNELVHSLGPRRPATESGDAR